MSMAGMSTVGSISEKSHAPSSPSHHHGSPTGEVAPVDIDPAMMGLHGADRPRVASLMPPPPAGGHTLEAIRWKPGRLTQAKLKKAAVVGLPVRAVAKLQQSFNVSMLSTGGVDAASKLAAKNSLEGEVGTRLRALRATCERRELSRLLNQIDVRLRDLSGRIIEIGMRELLGQLKHMQILQPVMDLPPIGHVSAPAPPRGLGAAQSPSRMQRRAGIAATAQERAEER